jgi:CheY-like chemotaxis protein
MDSTVLERAIEPFFTTKDIGKGTGLGLSMVHGLAAQSGGRLVLRSEIAKGTTAELWLQRAGMLIDREKRLPPDPVPHREKLWVLVVDDDPLVLDSVRAMLDELGHRVEIASSGEKALLVVRNQPKLDAVLTDYGMPEMSGVQLAHALRSVRSMLPVLLMTGFAELPAELAQEFTILKKPFRLSDLSAALTRLIMDAELNAVTR